jgi:hypothetical protein
MLGASIGKAAPQTLLGSQRGFVKCVRGRRLRANHKSCLVGVELEVGLGRVPRFLARAMSAKGPVQVVKSRMQRAESRAKRSKASTAQLRSRVPSSIWRCVRRPVGGNRLMRHWGTDSARADPPPSLSGSLYPATTSQDKDSVIVSWPAFLGIRVHAAISMGAGKERNRE